MDEEENYDDPYALIAGILDVEDATVVEPWWD